MNILSIYRTDPTVGTWATTWMSGIALAILVISLISGAIFALYWARKNKRNMKASYPGKFYLFISQEIFYSAHFFQSRRTFEMIRKC